MFAFQEGWENTEKTIGENGAAAHADLPKLILNWRIRFVLIVVVAQHVGNWN